MWDDQIDRAAHGLTEGTPGAAFTSRVLARVAGPAIPALHLRRGYGGRGAGRYGWLTGALAAAAVATTIVVTILNLRHVPATPARQPLPSLSDSQATAALPGRSELPTLLDARVAPEIHPEPEIRQRAEIPAASNESPFAPEPILIAPLAIAAIPEADSMAIDDLSTAPLEIGDITVPILAQ